MAREQELTRDFERCMQGWSQLAAVRAEGLESRRKATAGGNRVEEVEGLGMREERVVAMGRRNVSREGWAGIDGQNRRRGRDGVLLSGAEIGRRRRHGKTHTLGYF